MAQKDLEIERFSLEEKKKRLEEIRAFHKPLEKKDLMDHALKYEKIRSAKDHDIRLKRKAETEAERLRREKLPTFKSVRASQDSDVLGVLREPGQLLGIEKEKELIVKNKKKQMEKI